VPDQSNSDVGLPFLQGQWRKITQDPKVDKYPAGLSFSLATYRGTRAINQGMIWWDAGIYRVVDERTLVLSTATDEMVEYQISYDKTRLLVSDTDGNTVEYERVEPDS
jgi:hypothetical protein